MTEPANPAPKAPRRAAAAQRLDLNLLAIAAVLLEEGSVSRAALKLGLSQPSVSEALAKLRRHFNDPLFVRAAHGMLPTPRGAAVIGRAAELLRRLDGEVLADVRFEPAASTRPAVFALSDVGEMVFLPRLLERLRQEAPLATVRSVSLPPQAVAQGLERGEIDLAIGYFPDLKKNLVLQQRLMRHHFTCLLRADHPIRGERLTLAQYLALEHAVVQSEGRSQEIWERFLREKGVQRRVALSTPHFMSLPRIVSQSDMVVTVPHAIGAVYGNAAHGLRTIEPPFPSPGIELRQHWHRRFHKDPRNAWLRSVVSTLFNADADEW